MLRILAAASILDVVAVAAVVDTAMVNIAAAGAAADVDDVNTVAVNA
jgi:hypothetical protein